MAKVRLTVTLVREYDLNPEWYPNMTTSAEMAEYDQEQTEDPIFLADQIANDWFTITAKAEVIEEGSENG